MSIAALLGDWKSLLLIGTETGLASKVGVGGTATSVRTIGHGGWRRERQPFRPDRQSLEAQGDDDLHYSS